MLVASLASGTDVASCHDGPDVLPHGWPPKPLPEDGESLKHPWVTGKKKIASLLKHLRMYTKIHLNTVSWSITWPQITGQSHLDNGFNDQPSSGH